MENKAELRIFVKEKEKQIRTALMIDSFADIRILRYTVEGFEALPLEKKLMLYYLGEAALWGRDIFWHQNNEEGLSVRSLIEDIYRYQKSGGCLDEDLAEYAKQIWFANGVHHHYSNDKLIPRFSETTLRSWAREAGVEKRINDTLTRLIFDKDYQPKKVSLDTSADLVRASSVNFYRGVSQDEVEAFYAAEGRHPLNSRLQKETDGTVCERVWKADGMYGCAIKKIIENLERAEGYACNGQQRKAIRLLIDYYRSGDPDTFDEYSKEWVKDKESDIDFINGFIEVYDDPMGLKGTWESIVQLTDTGATQRTRAIASQAQWFEDHSPVDAAYRKKEVRGVSMNVIDAVMLGGDCYPSTPIGVNLPNADWIRETSGSKSITLSNITAAYHEEGLRKQTNADGSPCKTLLDEFALTDAERDRCRKYGRRADELHTELHECLGHGSGQMGKGISLDNLKAYGNTIEEARADLYALYFMADDKMVEIGASPCVEAAWAHYDSYLRNGILTQLARIKEGCDIEEAHMRNRALVARWVMEKASDGAYGKQPACAIVERGGLHYTAINDYEAVRNLFGKLLREIQRIKSEGDYEAAKDIVERYGVKIDPALHREVRQRYAGLHLKPFSGFVNPRLSPIIGNGRIIDIKISYDEMFDEQMLRYSEEYSTQTP